MADMPSLIQICDELQDSLRPASRTEIVRHVGALSLHYPQPDLPEAAHATRWDDWLSDFAEVPADILEAACRDWRRSAERFAPSPGQLLEKVKWIAYRKSMLTRAQMAISRLRGERI